MFLLFLDMVNKRTLNIIFLSVCLVGLVIVFVIV